MLVTMSCCQTSMPLQISVHDLSGNYDQFLREPDIPIDHLLLLCNIFQDSFVKGLDLERFNKLSGFSHESLLPHRQALVTSVTGCQLELQRSVRQEVSAALNRSSGGRVTGVGEESSEDG
ncbi:hypothetical protein H6P81_017530 [Aristolochia fimbriata]|uniref:Uncharacterized protein n=1 Tax=Aristolochia fimbriata TaxID=158543 RepID=A0AAV7E1I1_ARIFI|nr:hypothetical protein H6P81_017530 [Aristolochia fimbriata]